MSNNFDTKTFNQDNTRMRVNPMLQSKKFRLLLLLAFLPTIYITVFFATTINIEKLTGFEKSFLIIQITILLFSLLYFIYSIIKRKLYILREEKTVKLDNVDFEYYRDLIDEMSPGILSYCYNRKVNYEDTVISLMLVLQKKNYINVDFENERVLISEKDITNLEQHEKYFYNSLFQNNGNYIKFCDLSSIIKDDIFKGNFINLIKKDTKTQKYFTNKRFTGNLLTYIMLVNTILMFITAFKESILFIVYLFSIIIIAVFEYNLQKNSYLKTNKGEEVNKKLIGLKNFLTDFTNIENREIHELVLWDYYMIYAITFNLKGNLNNDVKQLYYVIIKEAK